MKTALSVTSAVVLMFAIGCASNLPSDKLAAVQASPNERNANIQVIDDAINAGEKGRTTITTTGDGTSEHPLGTDFDFRRYAKDGTQITDRK